MKTQTTFKSGKSKINTFAIVFISLLFSLNSSGQNINSILTETWTNQAWENFTLTTNTYTGNNLTNSVNQNWNTFSNSWQNVYQSNHTYDSNGNVSQSIFQSWGNVSNIWNNSSRFTFTYNASDRVLTTVIEIWDAGNWENTSKITNTYDDNNYLVTTLRQNWNVVLNSGSWRNLKYTIFTNNPNGTVNQQISQFWNNEASVWINSQRYSFTYDASNNILTSLIEGWHVGLNLWENSSKSTNTYDASNNLLTTIVEIWMTTNWMNATKETYTYDSNGYVTHSLFQNWDIPSSIWEDETQGNAIITYNPDGTAFQIVSQFWDYGLSIWNNIQRTTYNYSPLSISDFTDKNDFTAYPNPVFDIITIKTNNSIYGLPYFITDQTGKLVLTGTLNKEETAIDVNPFANGIYFIQIGQYEKQTIKMIKK
ncbi:MAG: T9SS type A sorting domain-containing protein [Flavobacterium sp.]